MSLAEVQTLEVSIRFNIPQRCFFQVELTRRIRCPKILVSAFFHSVHESPGAVSLVVLYRQTALTSFLPPFEKRPQAGEQ